MPVAGGFFLVATTRGGNCRYKPLRNFTNRASTGLIGLTGGSSGQIDGCLVKYFYVTLQHFSCFQKKFMHQMIFSYIVILYFYCFSITILAFVIILPCEIFMSLEFPTPLPQTLLRRLRDPAVIALMLTFSHDFQALSRRNPPAHRAHACHSFPRQAQRPRTRLV